MWRMFMFHKQGPCLQQLVPLLPQTEWNFLCHLPLLTHWPRLARIKHPPLLFLHFLYPLDIRNSCNLLTLLSYVTTIAPTSQKSVPFPAHKLGPDSHKGSFFGRIRGLFVRPQTASDWTSTAALWWSAKGEFIFSREWVISGPRASGKEGGKRERCCCFWGSRGHWARDQP